MTVSDGVNPSHKGGGVGSAPSKSATANSFKTNSFQFKLNDSD